MTASETPRVTSPERLRTLRSLDLLDREPLESFDRLTELTSELLDIPVVLVSLVEEDRQYFQSCVGLPEPWASRRETPLSHSFCKHVVETGEPLIIEDARDHPVVRDNLAIEEIGVVAYLGIPLVVDGHTLGSFCAIDSEPRIWTDREIRSMQTLAQSVLTELTLREELRAREEAEAALRESERRFRSLVEQSLDWIWETDLEGRFTYVSPAAESILGMAAEEIQGRTTFDFMEEGEAGRFAEELTAYLERDLPFHALGKTLQRGDGLAIQLETSGRPVRDEGGTVVGYRGIARDVTDQRLAQQREKELAVVEERRRSAEEARKRTVQILETMGDGFIALGDELQIAYANRAAQKILGAEDDIVGSPLSQAFPVLEDTRLEEVVHENPGSDRLVAFEEWIGDPGTWIEGRVVGREEGVSVYFNDLTVQVETRKAFEESRRQLRQAQKMEAVGLLAGGMAHDFNNVLAAIQGNAGLALAETGEDGRVREELEEILVAARRARGLTRQLLTFSRRDAGEPRPVSVASRAEELEKMLSRLIPSNVTLRVEARTEPAPVVIDPGHLEQVIVNLVVNARDAMPGGGAVRVTVDEVEDADGEWVVVEVEDEGVGMDEATRKSVFEPFFTTKDPSRGTGLGLSTVHGIVEQAEGRIELESEKGVGTTFRILLPRYQGEVDVAETHVAAVGEVEAAGEQVLVVDDDPSVLSTMRKILDRIGFEVHVAPGGFEALEWLTRSGASPDLVITDVMMPRMTGPELARELQDREYDGPVLFTSGYAEAEGPGAGSLPEGARVLEKPFTLPELSGRVREILDEERG